MALLWAKNGLNAISPRLLLLHISLSDILKDQHTSVYKTSFRILCVTYMEKDSLKPSNKKVVHKLYII